MSARAVLDKGIYLSSLSDEFKDNLVKLMISFDAPEGHVFIKEGDPIDSFLIVDSGSLVRTKKVSGGESPLEIDVIGIGKHMVYDSFLCLCTSYALIFISLNKAK